MWDSCLVRTLASGSRLAFGLTYALFFSTPSWSHGLFSLLPLVTISLADRAYAVGGLVFLPVAALATRIARWAIGHTIESWHCWAMTIPVAGLGLLVLVRAWPARELLASITASLSVGLLWFAYFSTVTDEREDGIIAVFAFLLMLQGIVGTGQFLYQRSLGLDVLGEFTLHPEGKLLSVVDIDGKRWLRAYGLTAHPNALGGYLAMWLLVCLGYAAKRRRGRTGPGGPVLWAAIAVGAGGLFCTLSRSAWLGLAAGLAYLGALMRHRLRGARSRLGDWQVIAGAVVLLTILAGAVLCYRELLITRFFRLDTPLESRSIRDRLEDVIQAWGLIRAHPWLGVGSGRYLHALWERAGDNPPPGFRLIHNIPLLAWAELGILGPVLWLWMLLTPLIVLGRASRRRRVTMSEAAWAAAFLAATILGMFDSYLYFPVTLWSTLGLGVLAGGWARSYALGESGG